ncbi:site-specific integrase [Candidatus Pacearchaeota archaeon]|nr:site-specific integrase [Candidatus Pacearchaeota archaeon]
MKKEYPSYRKTGLAFIKEKLTDKDRDTLNAFKEYVGMTACQDRTQRLEKMMLQFYDVTEVSFDAITLDILRGFLFLLNNSNRSIESTNDIKKCLKRFLRWKYQDWNSRFDGLKDIKTSNGINHQKINSSTILTTEELKFIVNGIDSIKFKALILLMYESGARPEEILKLKWRDIDFKLSQVILYSSKTKRGRVNPINESIVHLKRYKDECFYPPPTLNDFVFPNPDNKNKHISSQTLQYFFFKLEKRLDLKKHIFPYLLRHTRLTQIHKKLSPRAYEKFAGHSIELGTKRYAHLDNDDVREEMLRKVYKIEEPDSQDNEKIKSLEKQIENIKKLLHRVIDKSNYVYDSIGLPS